MIMLLSHYLAFVFTAIVTMAAVIIAFIGYDLIRDIISKYSDDDGF